MRESHTVPQEDFELVLVHPDGETRLFAGDLEACEEWLASNGDHIAIGHFELRPAHPHPEA